MCLDIKYKHKKLFTNKWKAKKLRKDMYVYKVLSKLKNGTTVTPYMGTSIIFKHGICSLPGYTQNEFEASVVTEVISEDYVSKIRQVFHYKRACKFGLGYHAFIKYKDAKKDVEYWRNTGFIGCPGGKPRSARIYLAKIPKGSYVFYGYNNEICANKLIIFKDEKK